MKITELLHLHEGFRRLPYEDTEGHLTIGVGHNLERPLSTRAIETILEDDINEARGELDRIYPKWIHLTETRQNVLIDMCFNMGAPRYQTFKKFWEALRRHDYNAAATELLDSKWAGQVGERATRLSKMMRDG